MVGLRVQVLFAKVYIGLMYMLTLTLDDKGTIHITPFDIMNRNENGELGLFYKQLKQE